MFSHLTDWELAIFGLVIAIFTVTPIPLFPDPYSRPKPNMFQGSRSSQSVRASIQPRPQDRDLLFDVAPRQVKMCRYTNEKRIVEA